jgi:uncharacterized membrane protein
MIQNPTAVMFTLAVVVLGSLLIEERFQFGRALGSALLAIVLAALLTNVGVLPAASSAYDAIGGIGVNVAITLILLGVDVRSVGRAGPRMLVAFLLGGVGTAVGAIIGALFLRDAIGPETWKLAGQFTGTYTGGGVNMVAVGQALETSDELFAAAVAADNVTTTLWMMATLAIPTVLGRWWPRAAAHEADPRRALPTMSHDFNNSRRVVTLRDTAALAVLVTGVLWLSASLVAAVPRVPRVLWLTTLALTAAQTPIARSLAGGPLLGNLVLHLFLAGLGAQSVIVGILRVGPAVFYFTVVVVAAHALLLFGVGRALRIDLATLAVASQANVGGPASAMALASAKGYTDRLVPGVAVGLLGYAVGNYLGFAVSALLRG